MKQSMKSYLTRICAFAGLAGLALMQTPAFSQQHNMATMADNKPSLTVGAAFAPDGNLWLVQQNEHARLVLQISKDDGNSWQEPRVLDTGTDTIKTSGEANPKILFGPKGVVIISYAQPLAKKFTGEIRMLRSVDGGAHFAAPVTVHQDRQVISHSFASMAFDGKGALHTVWIDSREMALAKAAAAKAGVAKPDYRGGAIYRNVSVDGGATFGPDTKLADYSCECCRIAITPTPDGQIAALWRHVTSPNIRDHAFTILSDAPAEATPVRATFDNWAIDGCPHHGPSVSIAASGGYHAVWFGVRTGTAQVSYGKLDQTGHPVGKVQALPDERAEHADLLSAGKKIAIVWRSFDGSGMNMKAWVSEDDGQHFSLKQLARTEGDSDYPRLLRKDDKLFVIWNTSGKRHVQAL
jgi:hypothetical protein